MERRQQAGGWRIWVARWNIYVLENGRHMGPGNLSYPKQRCVCVLCRGGARVLVDAAAASHYLDATSLTSKPTALSTQIHSVGRTVRFWDFPVAQLLRFTYHCWSTLHYLPQTDRMEEEYLFSLSVGMAHLHTHLPQAPGEGSPIYHALLPWWLRGTHALSFTSAFPCLPAFPTPPPSPSLEEDRTGQGGCTAPACSVMAGMETWLFAATLLLREETLPSIPLAWQQAWHGRRKGLEETSQGLSGQWRQWGRQWRDRRKRKELELALCSLHAGRALF